MTRVSRQGDRSPLAVDRLRRSLMRLLATSAANATSSAALEASLPALLSGAQTTLNNITAAAGGQAQFLLMYRRQAGRARAAVRLLSRFHVQVDTAASAMQSVLPQGFLACMCAVAYALPLPNPAAGP